MTGSPAGAPAAAPTTRKVSEAVTRIEAELTAIWAPGDGPEAPKVRACTQNMVVVSSTSELERLRDATDELNQTHAGRTFLVCVDPARAPWEVESAVSAVCRDGGAGSAPICADRIEVMLGAAVAERAGSIVRSLALAEVPTVLEVERGAAPSVVNALAREVDRILLDTAHTSVPRAAEIARIGRARIADRAFVRGFTWRELVARFFDDAPGASGDTSNAGALATISRLEIVSTPGTNDPAPLFLGWFASRLGWRFDARTRARATNGAEIAIDVRAEPRDGVGEGELASVGIVAELGGAALTLACERTTAARVLRWSKQGAASEQHHHPLGFRDETWVAVKAIDVTEGDAVYREALLTAAAWCAL